MFDLIREAMEVRRGDLPGATGAGSQVCPMAGPVGGRRTGPAAQGPRSAEGSDSHQETPPGRTITPHSMIGTLPERPTASTRDPPVSDNTAQCSLCGCTVNPCFHCSWPAPPFPLSRGCLQCSGSLSPPVLKGRTDCDLEML